MAAKKKTPSKAARKAASANGNPLIGMHFYNGTDHAEITHVFDGYAILQNYTLDSDNDPQLTDQRLIAVNDLTAAAIHLFTGFEEVLDHLERLNAPAPDQDDAQAS